jgi:hypothetical protein
MSIWTDLSEDKKNAMRDVWQTRTYYLSVDKSANYWLHKSLTTHTVFEQQIIGVVTLQQLETDVLTVRFDRYYDVNWTVRKDELLSLIASGDSAIKVNPIRGISGSVLPPKQWLGMRWMESIERYSLTLPEIYS